ncbi:hypothetical protein [Clostridium sporogenes]|uniref:hypothetical protein n=1 Tax=Clostridium sporogenes TaxID=1509 RepID=UPI00024BA2C3|nr:hypothetical protein [Clostridium sporogenes]EHN17103.1 hypothetical protein IYC_00210 [Clostridium sporogenes PA 3679]EJP6471388.1 hypothetical protein [Clostridium botulinum]
MSNKERAEKTYILLQQRKRDNKRKKRQDYYSLKLDSMSKMVKKYSNGKGMGQF